jgi:hypothetical protein
MVFARGVWVSAPRQNTAGTANRDFRGRRKYVPVGCGRAFLRCAILLRAERPGFAVLANPLGALRLAPGAHAPESLYLRSRLRS